MTGTRRGPKTIPAVNAKRPPAALPPDPPPDPESVTAGPVEKLLDMVFNASDDKLKEVTIIDRLQGRLLPQLDLINDMWQNCIEIAAYRQDSIQYKVDYHRTYPIPPNLIQRFLKVTAQWQKSVGGENLKKAMDVVLAEVESNIEDPMSISGVSDPFGDR